MLRFVLVRDERRLLWAWPRVVVFLLLRDQPSAVGQQWPAVGDPSTGRTPVVASQLDEKRAARLCYSSVAVVAVGSSVFRARAGRFLTGGPTSRFWGATSSAAAN